jgi:hypothetical protein
VKILTNLLNLIYPPEDPAQNKEHEKVEEFKMSIADLKNKVAMAKQIQAAGHANEKLGDHVGEQVVVVGMHITPQVEIKSAGLILDKVTYSLPDGTALDGWHLAATESAKALIEVLGEGPYNPPLLMEVKAQETKRGEAYYCELLDLYEDPANPLSLQAAIEESNAPEEQAAPAQDYDIPAPDPFQA